MNKQMVVYPHNVYYSAMKTNESLIDETCDNFKNFKSILLNEKCHSQNITFCMIPVICYSLKDIVKENRLVVAKRQG